MPEHLWERQEGESAKAFAAFECYPHAGGEPVAAGGLGEALTRGPGRSASGRAGGTQRPGW